MQAAIVGMGIIGQLLAFALHKQGWQVTLFEQQAEANNCSQAAAGLLTPFSELDKAEMLIHQLGLESVKSHWPNLLAELAKPVYFRAKGTLVLSHPRDVTEWLYFSRRISQQLGQEATYYQQLSKDALLKLEPELTRFETAYYFPEEAQLDCQQLLSVLKEHLVAQKLRTYHTKVLALEPGRVITAEQSYHFELVCDCRGLGAQAAFADLRALRGELLWLHAPEVSLARPIRFLHPRYSLYLVPRPGKLYLLGATELEVEDYSSISVRSTLELLTAAYSLHAGFAEARIVKTVTQCRPTLANHLPCIQFTEGLIAVNGLYRHGYLIAPALVEEILRALNSKQEVRHYPMLWEDLNV